MSRIQAGRPAAPPHGRSAGRLVATVVGDLAAALRGHAVRVDVPDDLPPIDVDLVLISRVLTNLLENAIRHGPKGTPITIQAELTARGARSSVSVTDHGPGVSPERRNEVFGLFARRDGDAGRRPRADHRQDLRRSARTAHLGERRPGRRREVLLHAAVAAPDTRGAAACRRYSSLMTTRTC